MGEAVPEPVTKLAAVPVTWNPVTVLPSVSVGGSKDISPVYGQAVAVTLVGTALAVLPPELEELEPELELLLLEPELEPLLEPELELDSPPELPVFAEPPLELPLDTADVVGDAGSLAFELSLHAPRVPSNKAPSGASSDLFMVRLINPPKPRCRKRSVLLSAHLDGLALIVDSNVVTLCDTCTPQNKTTEKFNPGHAKKDRRKTFLPGRGNDSKSFTCRYQATSGPDPLAQLDDQDRRQRLTHG
jgi:hypothetical protein